MSTQSKQHHTHHFTSKGFSGIDLKNPKDNASDVCNFRIMPDGSLMKRPGFKRIASLPGDPSYFGVFNINSEEVGLAIIGAKLFKVNLSTGEYTQYTGDLGKEPGICNIVFYKEDLLIFDGSSPRIINDDHIATVKAYAPLYGKGWSPLNRGPVNEPLNLISPTCRINYTLTPDTSTIRLPDTTTSVDHIEVDGKVIPPTDYSFNATTKFVDCYNFTVENGSATLWISYDPSSSPEVMTCTQALSVSSDSNSVMFCYGRPNDLGIYCYRSHPLTKEEFAETERVYPEALDLYFPAGCGFSVGMGGNIIRSVIPYDDRVIVFSDNDAWFVPVKSDVLTVESLNRSIGCSSPFASAYCGDSPVTVCHNRLFIWTPTLDPYNPFNAVSVSKQATLPTPSKKDKIKVFVSPYENEVWIFDSSSDKSNIVIYNYETKKWFNFSGFYPKFAFNFRSSIGFSEGTDLFLFDSNAVADERTLGNPQNISAVYTSGWSKLDDIGKIKHANRLITEAFSGTGGNISITLLYNDGRSVDIPFSAVAGSDSPQIFSKHLPNTSFREIRFRINANGASSERIYCVSLDYTENDGNY